MKTPAISRACLAAAFLFTTGSASAWTVQELQTKMREADSALKSVQFDFTQETRSELTPEVRKSSGTAWARKPRDLRLEQKSPEEQLIVASGKTVTVYTPRFKQALTQKADSWFGQNLLFPGLAGFSGTLDRLANDFIWTLSEEMNADGGRTIKARLEGKAAKREGETLILWIAETDFIPRKTEYRAQTLSLTTQVSALKINPDPPADLFKFRLPPKATLIRMP